MSCSWWLYDGQMSDFIGEVVELPGVLVYGTTRDEAVARAKALAFRVLADRLEHGEEIPEIQGVFAVQG